MRLMWHNARIRFRCLRAEIARLSGHTEHDEDSWQIAWPCKRSRSRVSTNGVNADASVPPSSRLLLSFLSCSCVVPAPAPAPETLHIMQLTAQLVGIVAILLALGDCQTTPGTSPSSNRHLSVAYGQSELQANDLLPQACKIRPRQ